MMSDITSLYDDFFEHHPRASLLLSHTGTLRLNAVARVLFGVNGGDDQHIALQALLHPADYQKLHYLLTTHTSLGGRHIWRWLVTKAPMSHDDSPAVHTTSLTTYVTLTEHGCSVVLEPIYASADSTSPDSVNDTVHSPQDTPAELEHLCEDHLCEDHLLEDHLLEDIVNTAQTLSKVHSSHELPLEVALEHLPFAVFCVDKQWRFSFVNTPAAHALGVTPTDMLGRSLWEVAPELSQHAMGDHYRKAMAHGRASYHEVVAHDPPFTGRWHATHLRPFAEGLLVTIKDITQRKRSEEALLAQKAYSDQLLAERNAILASIDDYFFILDKSWTVTYANDATAAYFSTTSEKLIGKHFWDVADLPAEHPIVERYQQAMNLGRAQDVEAASSRYPDTYLAVHIYPYENGLVVYGKDITERKQLEHHLQQALKDKEAILDSISDMMVGLDSDWRITYVNRSVQTFLSKDALGKHYFDLYPDNRGSIFEEKYQQVFDSQQPVTFEAQGSRSGKWLEHRVYPHQGGIVIYATDISERKRLAEQLEHTLAERDTILNSITDTIVVLDRNWTFRFVNNQARKLAANHHVRVGASYWQAFPHNEGSIFVEKYRQAFDKGIPVRFEARNSLGMWRDINVYPSHDQQTITIYSRDIDQERKLEQNLQRALQERDAIFDSITERVSVLDRDLRYVYVNKHARKLMPPDPVGKTIAELLGEDDYDTTCVERFRAVFATGKPIQFEHASPTDNTWRDIRIYPSNDGNTITVYSGDITERKKLEQDLQNALAQKDMLMKELHHRTKNNLQLVASMLALQAQQLSDEGAKVALQNSRNRIRTLADIHNMLYRQDADPLDTASYLQLLADNIVKSTSRAPMRLEYALDPLDLPLEHTIALGLIANELITNALKHAFIAPSDEDTIGLQLTATDTTVTFTVYNNGAPLADDRENSLGMTIITALSEQLGGDFELVNTIEGVVARINFKKSITE